MSAPLPDGPLEARLPGDPHFVVWSALEAVADPEIPVVNLREMGILRAVRHSASGLEVVITPTYSGCPAMRQMNDDVVDTLRSAGLAARVVTQLAPPWTTDWMTDAARDKLRAYGIAPPHACAVESAGRGDFICRQDEAGARCLRRGLPAVWLGPDHRGVALWLDRLQGALPLSELP
jgi:ring-1,2-phenylacetyl-CoA epoxidase subunit PaaD